MIGWSIYFSEGDIFATFLFICLFFLTLWFRNISDWLIGIWLCLDKKNSYLFICRFLNWWSSCYLLLFIYFFIIRGLLQRTHVQFERRKSLICSVLIEVDSFGFWVILLDHPVSLHWAFAACSQVSSTGIFWFSRILEVHLRINSSLIVQIFYYGTLSVHYK